MCFSFFALSLPYTDSEVIYRNSDGHVIKFNILTNETEIVLPNTTFVSRCCIYHCIVYVYILVLIFLHVSLFISHCLQVNFNVAKYSVSPDLKYVLFAYDVKQVSSLTDKTDLIFASYIISGLCAVDTLFT